MTLINITILREKWICQIKLLEDIFGKDYHQSNQNMSTCNFIDDYVDSRIRIADQVSLNIKTSSMFWFTNA